MWLISEYKPISLFSLKPGTATSTGGKTLFLPTPFAIRTALLDAAIRTQGIAAGQLIFGIIKAVGLALLAPKQVAVTNLFTKIQKPARGDQKNEEDDDISKSSVKKVWTSTIGFREYAFLSDKLGIAFDGDENKLNIINDLLPQVNYFGKRGGFFQLLDIPARERELPNGYCLMKDANNVIEKVSTTFPLGVIQTMDDWGAELDFEKVNIYSETKTLRIGQDRLRSNVIFPYRLTRSSKSFSLYERIDSNATFSMLLRPDTF